MKKPGGLSKMWRGSGNAAGVGPAALFLPLIFHLIKFVAIHGSCPGGSRFAFRMDFSIQAIFFPRVRIVCRPSRSCRTSSGVLPWTEFQYCEVTTGIGSS